MTASKYTAEERAHALELYLEVGAGETARRTGIPQPTISSWARRAGVQSDAPQKTRDAVEAARVKWEQRRLEIADTLGDALAEFVDAARKAAEKGDGRNAKDLMTAGGIAYDKAELRAGGATSRSEIDVTDPSGRLAAVHDLKQQAASRAAAKTEGTGA